MFSNFDQSFRQFLKSWWIHVHLHTFPTHFDSDPIFVTSSTIVIFRKHFILNVFVHCPSNYRVTWEPWFNKLRWDLILYSTINFRPYLFHLFLFFTFTFYLSSITITATHRLQFSCVFCFLSSLFLADMSDQQRSSSGTPAVPRQLTGRARRIMAHGFTDDTGLFVSDLHAHATVIYHSLSQTLNFISSHMDKHADCPCTDLIDAALYVQTARDRLMQGLVKTFGTPMNSLLMTLELTVMTRWMSWIMSTKSFNNWIG